LQIGQRVRDREAVAAQGFELVAIDELLLSRLLGEKFAGTPIGEHFLPGDA